MFDLLIIPKLILFSILTTYLVDIVLILQGEILSWSLMGVKRLIISQPSFLCFLGKWALYVLFG